MVLTTNLMDASRVRSAVPDAAVARSLADDALAPRNQRAKKTGPPNSLDRLAPDQLTLPERAEVSVSDIEAHNTEQYLDRKSVV